MILTIFMIFYRLAWALLLPVVLIYLWRRGRKDPLYAQNLGERFGIYGRPLPQDAIWVHAVSLGEIRSAIALINLMLARGDRVVVTNFTPAGRREALAQFADHIAAGQLAVVWGPFDMAWVYRRFFRACAPKIALTLEVEVWPAMIHAARRAGVPIYMCNGQYGSRPLARDSRGLRIRQRVIRQLSGAFVKSELQAQRFIGIGTRNVVVTGELRFDQPIPQAQIDAAAAMDLPRPVITIASGVDTEEDLYIDVIKQMNGADNAPLFVYVPRAPERFDAVAEKLAIAGLTTARRSVQFADDLSAGTGLAPSVAVLLGDSLGEMYFYLSLADRVVVGGGFTPHGAHNIIEPLARGKTVITGPTIWPIEYPFAEAEAAGVAQRVQNPAELVNVLHTSAADRKTQITQFLADHGGASARTLAAIDAVLAQRD